MTLVVAGIGLVYGLNVMGDIKSDFCDDSVENWYNGACYSCKETANPTFYSASQVCLNQSAQAGSSNVSATSYGQQAEDNATVNAVEGVAKIPEKMPLIATVIVAAVIIGILVRYLMVRFA